MASSVTVQLNGKMFAGTYTVAQHVITVSCGTAHKTAVLWGMQPRPIARMLFWQIAREWQAHDEPACRT